MALLKDYAIIVDARDNVAVVKNAVPAGTNIELSGRTIRIVHGRQCRQSISR